MNKETALAVMEQAELPAVPEQQLDVAVQNFMGINIGGDTVTRCTSHLPDDQKVLVRWLYNLARDKKWGWNDLARETGVDKSVAWRIFQDKYRIPMEQVTEENGVKIRRPHPKAGERISLEGICSKIAKAKKLFEERDSVFASTARARLGRRRVWRNTPGFTTAARRRWCGFRRARGCS
jgi:hypothetical protein